MLATGSRVQYPIASTGWFLVIVVNARKESRQRLLQLLTHSNILPLDTNIFLAKTFGHMTCSIISHISTSKTLNLLATSSRRILELAIPLIAIGT
jgi:hypothetical protein